MIASEGITQTEFSKRIGVSVTQLTSAIQRNDFSNELIDKITKYFGVDMTFLQRESGNYRSGRHKKS